MNKTPRSLRQPNLGAYAAHSKLPPKSHRPSPPSNAKNVRHYTRTTKPNSVLWTGYYATYSYFGVKLAVANALGVYFEIRRRENTWEAIRRARASLNLNDWPLYGIDMAALSTSGEPISITRLHGTRATTTDSTVDEGEEKEPKRTTEPMPKSSQTERGRGLRRSRSNRFTLEDVDSDSDSEGYRCLKGQPPKTFDGDRARTLTFLSEFNQFMLKNREADIPCDPVKKSLYFLSLIKGEMVELWVHCQDKWLWKVEDDDDPTTAWQTLEQNFKTDFFDYAGPEIAQQQILKLRMKDGNVDKYIADFKELARRAGHNADELYNLQLFARGLPRRLADNCIDFENPETFEQWAKAAQQQQKN